MGNGHHRALFTQAANRLLRRQPARHLLLDEIRNQFTMGRHDLLTDDDQIWGQLFGSQGACQIVVFRDRQLIQPDPPRAGNRVLRPCQTVLAVDCVRM